MNKQTVHERIARSLAKLESYHQFEVDGNGMRPLRANPPVMPGEQVLGYYENLKGVSEERIFFTHRALYVFRGIKWTTVPYDQILAVQIPVQCAKDNVNALELLAQNGSSMILPVRGCSGSKRDVFAVKRFLEQVSQDQMWEEFTRDHPRIGNPDSSKFPG